jgi:transcriptional repressor NrdR
MWRRRADATLWSFRTAIASKTDHNLPDGSEGQTQTLHIAPIFIEGVGPTLASARLREVNCPHCDSPTSILETRKTNGGLTLRRRRECSQCGHRFTTYERAVPETLQVVKRDGHRQPFDREKLLRSLNRATHKRTLDPRKLSLLVDGVEREVRGSGGELSAERIAELCLDGLARIDRGAYQQFAGTLPDAGRSAS